MTTTRRQILAFRLRRQNLTRRLPATRLADAAAPCGVRNTPPGSARVALLARVARVSAVDLVEVHGPQLVPTLVRPEDVAVFTVGAVGTDDASLRETLGRVASTALADAGIGPTEALARVVEAARAELADGTTRSTGDLSAALTARLPAPMSLWCRRCGSRHVHEALFRLAGAVGVYRIAPRSGRGVSYVRMDAAVPAYGSDAARDAGHELLRRFLRCYGPATPADFAGWTRIGVADARRRFAALDLRDGPTGSLLRDDVDELRAARPPSGVRLLPPYDPYLLGRDRATLVPDPAMRRVIWPAIGAPGTVVVDGEIVATWRAQAKGTVLRLQVDSPVPVEREARRLADLRDCRTVEVTGPARAPGGRTPRAR